MSCLSDIDLATLHRTRLEERVHYKLSWWTRRLTDKQTNNYYRQSQMNNMNRTTNVTIISKIESECIEKKVMTAITMNSINGDGDNYFDKTTSDSKCHVDDQNINEHTNGNHSDRLHDENTTNIDVDHFPILRRRRSGTWP